jgi:hypothetical protein
VRTWKIVSESQSDCNRCNYRPVVAVPQYRDTVSWQETIRNAIRLLNDPDTYAFVKLCLDDIGTKHFLEVRDDYAMSISGRSTY